MGDTYNDWKTISLDFRQPVEEPITIQLSSSENLFLAQAVLDRTQMLAEQPRTSERDEELRVAYALTRRMLDLTRESHARNMVQILGLSN